MEDSVVIKHLGVDEAINSIIDVTVKEKETFEIGLGGCLTLGDQWEAFLPNYKNVQINFETYKKYTKYVPDNKYAYYGEGCPGKFIFIFKAIKKGEEKLEFTFKKNYVPTNSKFIVNLKIE